MGMKTPENYFSMARGQRSDELELRRERALRCRCINAGRPYYTPAQRKAQEKA
jgi:hypothetical protein